MRHRCVPRSTPRVSRWRHSSDAPPPRPRRRHRRRCGRICGARSTARRARRSRAPSRRCTTATAIDVLGMHFSVLDVPGHTAGHIAYLQQARPTRAPAAPCSSAATRSSPPAAAACSRARPAQMIDSLTRLAALPADTQVCCTHEYTLSNLRFAAAVEPGNAERAAIRSALPRAARRRPAHAALVDRPANGGSTLSCAATSPRSWPRRVRRAPTSDDTVAVFTALREWKNRFR